ncbi:MAG: hypothetical protein MZU97_19850 [Bacillus subtilis]|nr:hypothetical protein [Bacillus subtilis]
MLSNKRPVPIANGRFATPKYWLADKCQNTTTVSLTILASILAEYRPLLPIENMVSSDRFHGALLGRGVGCALGKPLEAGPYFWDSTPTNPGWKNVKKWFVGAQSHPIRDYVPSRSSAEHAGLYVICPESQKETIRYLESDDDIRYTVSVFDRDGTLRRELHDLRHWQTLA